MEHLSSEIQYIIVAVGLFIIPRILQRFRLPSAITCVGLGALFGMGLHLFHEDTAIPLLATLGIVSLFLFAGLEVNFSELQRGFRVLLQHAGVQALLLIVASGVVMLAFGLEVRAAILFALALLTPSTGFILDSLPSFGLKEERQFWVKIKAISSEVVALLILFITVQSSDVKTLAISSASLIAIILILPPILIFSLIELAHTHQNQNLHFLLLLLLFAHLLQDI